MVAQSAFSLLGMAGKLESWKRLQRRRYQLHRFRLLGIAGKLVKASTAKLSAS